MTSRFLFDGAQTEIGALPIVGAIIAAAGTAAYIGGVLIDEDDLNQGFFVGDTRCQFLAIGEVVVWGTNPFSDFTSLVDDDAEALVDDDAEPLVSE